MAQSSELMVCPGLFYAVPAQDGIISRLRTPGGMLTSQQSRVVAHFADQCGDGYIQITNRANPQIRAVRTVPPPAMLTAFQAAGLASSSASVDHLRNIMASPTAGIDPHTLIDTRALITALDDTIAQHAEFAGLPAKFSVGIDGGEAVSVRNRPNDIWLVATAVEGPGTEEHRPVFFRLFLNGGQGQELDTGLLLCPEECIPMVVAIAHVYLAHVGCGGHSTTGKKPRLRQVLAQQGVAWYMDQVLHSLPFAVHRHPAAVERSAGTSPSYRHIGLHPQWQPGLSYLGVVVPLGRLATHQLRELAHLAQMYGSGTLRLTPWQNVLIPDVPDRYVPALQQAIAELELPASVTHPWSALVACAGNTGCSSSATNTTAHALGLASYLAQRVPLDRPVNIHVSGCPKSCAQHHQSDIALLGITMQQGDISVEGYRVYVGTGDEPFGRPLYQAVPAADIPALLTHMLQIYQDNRCNPDESFGVFANRYAIADLQQLFDQPTLSQSHTYV
jgi:ferredoxin-nitrite reductase